MYFEFQSCSFTCNTLYPIISKCFIFNASGPLKAFKSFAQNESSLSKRMATLREKSNEFSKELSDKAINFL